MVISTARTLPSNPSRAGLALSRAAAYRFSIISKNDNRGPAMGPDLDAAPDSEKLVQPLGGAVKFILILAAVLLGIVLVFAVFGTIQLGGLGSGPACLAVHLNDITVTGAHLRPG